VQVTIIKSINRRNCASYAPRCVAVFTVHLKLNDPTASRRITQRFVRVLYAVDEAAEIAVHDTRDDDDDDDDEAQWRAAQRKCNANAMDLRRCSGAH